jgi:hypothetical protein
LKSEDKRKLTIGSCPETGRPRFLGNPLS